MDAVKMDSAAKLDVPAKGEPDNLGKATLAGGLIAAIIASACCLGPLVLVTIGVSGGKG